MKENAMRHLWFERFEARLCLSAVEFAPHVLAIPDINVMAAEVTGDGRMDIVGIADEVISVYERIADSTQFSTTIRSPIVDGFDGRLTQIADIDLDGDNDLLVSGAHLAWLENDGFGRFQLHSEVRRPPTWAASLTDIDNDRDLDLVALYWLRLPRVSIGELAWYENIDRIGLGTFGTAIRGLPGFNTYRSASHLVTADLNGDGFPDVLSTHYEGGGCQVIVLHKNLAQPSGRFSEPRSVGCSKIPPIVMDFDDDGDQDVLGLNGSMWWLENTNGKAAFEQHTLGFQERASSHEMAFTGDVDGDGDLDLVLQYDGQLRKLIWLEKNDEGPSFEEVHEIDQGVRLNQVVDLDADGDDDILAYVKGQLVWFESRSTQHPTAAPSTLDIDGDGKVGFAEFLAVSDNFGNPARLVRNGDMNNDRRVDFADFLLVSEEFYR